ncbi:MAG: hypothetical protein GXP35_01025 [Actinobacteria bacterium]|nr:hypothetical protein [Actinomycetota bacterium]
MIRVVRSEFIRIWRPAFRYGGIGVMASFAALISVFIFTAADSSGSDVSGPGGGAFANAAEIAQPGGFLVSLETLSSLAGIVLLSLWAIAAASDYDTGLVRVLVQAEPNRIRLLGGKIIALAGYTFIATIATVFTAVFVARPLARLEGIDTTLWRTDFFEHLVGETFNFMVPAMVWGLIGLLIAVWSKSSGLAIGVGIGYLLIVENLIAIVAEGAADFLPGGTLAAVAAGGTADLAWTAALGLTVLYGAAAAATALLIFRSRDITS